MEKIEFVYNKAVPIVFHGKVEGEDINNCITKLSEVEEDKMILLYISSVGGQVAEGRKLVHLLNTLYRTRLILIAYLEVDSSAFDIFMKYNGKKEVLEDTNSTIHLYNSNLSERNLLDSFSYDKFLQEDLRSCNAKYLNWISKEANLTTAEIKKMKKGQDVYLGYSRLRELVDNHNSNMAFDIIFNPQNNEQSTSNSQ